MKPAPYSNSRMVADALAISALLTMIAMLAPCALLAAVPVLAIFTIALLSS